MEEALRAQIRGGTRKQVAPGEGAARVSAWDGRVLGICPTTIALWVLMGPSCSISKMPPLCFLATSTQLSQLE